MRHINREVPSCAPQRPIAPDGEGLTDVYPERPGPGEHFVTKAMAEGAIEGTAAMYEVAAPYSTEFAFSRFDALPEDSSREGSSHEHQFESRNSDGRLTVDLE